MTQWTPGVRHAQRKLEAPYELVPDHLLDPLVNWSHGFYRNDSQLLERRAIEFRLRFTTSPVLTLQGLTIDDPVFHLNLIEFLLETQCSSHVFLANTEAGDSLEALLMAGNSMYTVRADHGALELRVLPEDRAQVEQVIQDAEEGAAHWLTEAWNDAYSRVARPGASYDASIKAVEAALRVIVIPGNTRGTITQIINGLRDGRAKFVLVLQDSRGVAAGANEPVVDTLDTVLAMLRALAYGQKTRHGQSGPVTINAVEEARVAVHLAVTLVQIATGGALQAR